MPLVNANAQDRQSDSISKSGIHTHEGCATLDILPSPKGPHIIYDITNPIEFIFPYGPTTVYLEKLFPKALFNPDWTPEDGTILHPTTFMNCFHLLQPGGKIVFDFNTSVLIKPGSKPADFNWDPSIPAVSIETKYPQIFESALLKKSSGEKLNELEERFYSVYYTHITNSIRPHILQDLTIFGFINFSISEGKKNPYNERTDSQFLISADKPTASST